QWIQFDHLIHLTSASLRYHEIDVDKPPATFRILVLGDSFAEGDQVALEETFCKRIERALRDGFPGRMWEVVNAGVSRYGTADEIELFQVYGRRLQPDVVVLAFFLGNDVRDNRDSRFFRWHGRQLVEPPAFVPSRATLLLARLKEAATSHSQIVQLARDRI